MNQPQHTSGIATTNQWINVYSIHSTYNGNPLPMGATVTAIGEDGRMLGQVTVQRSGSYGVLAIYRDDSYTAEIDGARSGEHIRFLINGKPAAIVNRSDLVWTSNGDLFQVNLEATGEEMLHHHFLPYMQR